MKETGLTPMQINRRLDRYAAELVQKQDSLGTIEAGKTADLLVVNADPLQDIGNLMKTDTVIFDGKVVDRSYHANYRTPSIPGRREHPGGDACRGPLP